MVWLTELDEALPGALPNAEEVTLAPCEMSGAVELASPPERSGVVELAPLPEASGGGAVMLAAVELAAPLKMTPPEAPLKLGFFIVDTRACKNENEGMS